MSLPGVPLFVSTGTATARQLADTELQGLAEKVFRAPLELSFCVARVFSCLRPRLLIIAETELWPNYFWQARRSGVNVLIVNGRISDRSASRYKALRFLFKKVLQCADHILVQSETDRERFIAAGALYDKTVTGGNLKYDFDHAASSQQLQSDLQEFIERTAADLVIVAGSTREHEEALLVPALQGVASVQERVLFVVAPRHPHRFNEAEHALVASGLKVVRRSKLGEVINFELPAILLLDSLGELSSLYHHADFVFIGGSLNKWGGHNILEAVLYGCPVVVGPDMQNFQLMTNDLKAVDGLIQVSDAKELVGVFMDLAVKGKRRYVIGKAGQEFAKSQRGASVRAASEAVRLYKKALPVRPPSTLAWLALVLPSYIWSLFARLHRYMREDGTLHSRQLATPVISIGNITVGGTGKTPTTAWLVERMAEAGYMCAVLTRGYGRNRINYTHLLHAGDSYRADMIGDEPAMLVRKFKSSAPSTLVAVGTDRYETGRRVESRTPVNLFVLDDGFQHLRLKRSLDIVLLDASQPVGNGYTLPLGTLREPLSALKNADIVILTRIDPTLDYSDLHNIIHYQNPNIRIFEAQTVIRRINDAVSGTALPLTVMNSKWMAAFCGIGNPQSFWSQLDQIDCKIVYKRAFRDHHRYLSSELLILQDAAIEHGAEALVTTAKDIMNIGKPPALKLPLYCLEIEMQINQEKELLALVLMKLQSSPD